MGIRLPYAGMTQIRFEEYFSATWNNFWAAPLAGWIMADLQACLEIKKEHRNCYQSRSCLRNNYVGYRPIWHKKRPVCTGLSISADADYFMSTP